MGFIWFSPEENLFFFFFNKLKGTLQFKKTSIFYSNNGCKRNFNGTEILQMNRHLTEH